MARHSIFSVWNILRLVVAQISPELREALEEWVEKLDEKAQQTKTQWDDFLVGLLRLILGM